MGKRWYSTYTLEQLAEFVKESTSYRGVLKKCGLKPTGGNYAVLKMRIKEMGLDTSHFLGAGWAKGKKFNGHNKTPLEDILKENTDYWTNGLRKRLIAEGYFEHRCSNCNLTEWMGVPIPIELDHIDGDRFDNRLENLRLLCPNCHALTHNYRGKNKKSRSETK